MKAYTKYLKDLIQSRKDHGLQEWRQFGSSSYDPDYKGSAQYNNEVEELEGLLGGTSFTNDEMMRRDFLARKYGINGPQDFSKLQAIKNNELSRIGTLQQNLIKTSAEDDARYDATQNPKALRAQAAELIKRAEELERAPAAPAAAAPSEAAPEVKSASPAVDPMQMWNALTQQFQNIAATALKDVGNAASQTAPKAAAPAKKAAGKTASTRAAARPAAKKAAPSRARKRS